MALDKKKKIKIMLIGSAIIAIAIAVYVFIIKPKQDANAEDQLDTGSVNKSTASSSVSSNSATKYTYTPFPGFDKKNAVSKFDSGTEVKQLQSYFVDKGLTNPVTGKKWVASNIDGKWGNGTQATLEALNIPTGNGTKYSSLTKALYDKLGLSHYNV